MSAMTAPPHRTRFVVFHNERIAGWNAFYCKATTFYHPPSCETRFVVALRLCCDFLCSNATADNATRRQVKWKSSRNDYRAPLGC